MRHSPPKPNKNKNANNNIKLRKTTENSKNQGSNKRPVLPSGATAVSSSQGDKRKLKTDTDNSMYEKVNNLQEIADYLKGTDLQISPKKK